jgi:four helix bundle protein
VRSNIVEGYGRKKYPKDYIRFIIYALSSNDESIDHLEILHEIGEIKDPEHYEFLRKKMIRLGVKLNNFLKVLEKDQRDLKEPMVFYEVAGAAPPRTE